MSFKKKPSLFEINQFFLAVSSFEKDLFSLKAFNRIESDINQISSRVLVDYYFVGNNRIKLPI